VLVNLSEIDVDRWKNDCLKKRKSGIIESLIGKRVKVIDKKMSDHFGTEKIPGFTDIVKIGKLL